MARLIGFIVIICIGFVGYNYYMGDAEDKERAEQIVDGVKGIGSSVKDMFMEEKEKYERGDYDKTLDKIGSFVDKLKSKSGDLEKSDQDNLKGIEKEIVRLTKELKNLDDEDSSSRKKIERDIKKLVKKANELYQHTDQ